VEESRAEPVENLFLKLLLSILFSQKNINHQSSFNFLTVLKISGLTKSIYFQIFSAVNVRHLVSNTGVVFLWTLELKKLLFVVI